MDGRLLARPEPAAAPASPLLVMLHGAGATGQQSLDLVGVEAAAHGIAVVAPSSAGRTWDLIAGRLGPDVRALDELLRDAFAQLHVDPARVAIGGFSDGASYALSLGLANGDLFGEVLAFSPGFAAPPRLVGRPRILVTHGAGDRVLPIDRTSRPLVERLAASGYDVTYEEFDGGHEVRPTDVRSALARLAGAVGTA